MPPPPLPSPAPFSPAVEVEVAAEVEAAVAAAVAVVVFPAEAAGAGAAVLRSGGGRVIDAVQSRNSAAAVAAAAAWIPAKRLFEDGRVEVERGGSIPPRFRVLYHGENAAGDLKRFFLGEQLPICACLSASTIL